MAHAEVLISPAPPAPVSPSGFATAPAPDHWRPDGNARSFIAMVDGVVAGHVRAVDNSFHPGSRTLTVEVLPEYRRQGLGTALLAAQLEVSDRPLRTRVTESDVAARALARRFDAVVVQAVPPRRHVVTADLRIWAAARQGTVDRLSDADGHELLDLWVRHYVTQHATWSPADPDAVRRWLATLLPPAADVPPLSNSTVLRRGDRIVAAALAWPSEAGDRAESFPVYEVNLICADPAAATSRRDMEICLAGLIGQCPDGATMLIEGHATEPYELMLIVGLPHTEPRRGDDWLALLSVPVAPGSPLQGMDTDLLPRAARWMAAL